MIVTRPPWRSASISAPASTSRDGRCSGGHATRISIAASAPASMSEWATPVPASPTKAISRPARPPKCSRSVSRSATAWQGRWSSESALITGTVACAAIRRSARWGTPWTMSAAAATENVRAMSPNGSPLPTTSSRRGSNSGSMPSRWAATAADSVAPVVGGSKKQASVCPSSAPVKPVASGFIRSARSSSSTSAMHVRSPTDSRCGGQSMSCSGRPRRPRRKPRLSATVRGLFRARRG
jgi:hypothetical protein